MNGTLGVYVLKYMVNVRPSQCQWHPTEAAWECYQVTVSRDRIEFKFMPSSLAPSLESEREAESTYDQSTYHTLEISNPQRQLSHDEYIPETRPLVSGSTPALVYKTSSHRSSAAISLGTRNALLEFLQSYLRAQLKAVPGDKEG